MISAKRLARQAVGEVNYCKLRKQYHRAVKHFRANKLSYLGLDISGRCNLSCEMCSFQDWFKSKGLMSLETLKTLVLWPGRNDTIIFELFSRIGYSKLPIYCSVLLFSAFSPMVHLMKKFPQGAIRRVPRHSLETRAASISAAFNQLPCFGCNVPWNDAIDVFLAFLRISVTAISPYVCSDCPIPGESS